MYYLEWFSNKATIHVETDNYPVVADLNNDSDSFLLQVVLYFSPLYCIMNK